MLAEIGTAATGVAPGSEDLARLRAWTASASMPVATTDTRILPSRSLLNAEPQMMFASGSTSSLMWLAASSTSIRRMSSPPVIEMMTPLAPFMLTPSSSGLEIAFSAASIARLSPDGFAGAHHRLAHLAHHRADVGEVEVDEARHDHQVGDPANALLEHLVGHLERFLEGRVRVGEAEQVLVRNDDQRVDVLLQLVDAGIGRAAAARAFERERLGDHADGQDALVAGGLGDDRRGAGAGAAAHAGGDEAHVRAFERAFDDLSIVSSAAARPISGREPAPRPWVIFSPSWMR